MCYIVWYLVQNILITLIWYYLFRNISLSLSLISSMHEVVGQFGIMNSCGGAHMRSANSSGSFKWKQRKFLYSSIAIPKRPLSLLSMYISIGLRGSRTSRTQKHWENHKSQFTMPRWSMFLFFARRMVTITHDNCDDAMLACFFVCN